MCGRGAMPRVAPIMQNLCQRKASTCALHTKPRLAPMVQSLALPHRHRLQGPAADSVCESVPRHLLISQPHPPSPMQFIHPAPFGFKLCLANEETPSCPFRCVSRRSGEPSSTLTPNPTIDNRQSELLTHPRRRPSGSSRDRSSSFTTCATRLCT